MLLAVPRCALGRDQAVGVYMLRGLTVWVLLWSMVLVTQLVVDNTTDHVSSVLDLPVSSSRTPSSLSDDPTAMMCRWKSLQQWVHQSSRLSCCKRPTTPSRLLWSKLPCMVRRTPRADTLILCTSCVFTGSVDDCRHQSYVLRLPAHALVILLKCLYKASSAKVLSPRLSSSRLATHF